MYIREPLAKRIISNSWPKQKKMTVGLVDIFGAVQECRRFDKVIWGGQWQVVFAMRTAPMKVLSSSP